MPVVIHLSKLKPFRKFKIYIFSQKFLIYVLLIPKLIYNKICVNYYYLKPKNDKFSLFSIKILLFSQFYSIKTPKLILPKNSIFAPVCAVSRIEDLTVLQIAQKLDALLDMEQPDSEDNSPQNLKNICSSQAQALQKLEYLIKPHSS